jgi:CheY-like chemotaxis protein
MRMASTKHLTAVVVEDDCDQRALAATLLEETQFDVIECDSAESALDIVHERKNRVALVFTDLRLAGRMDGVQLARILDRDCPDTSVILTSGDPGDRLSNLPANAVYMAKPWRPLEIIILAEWVRTLA